MGLLDGLFGGGDPGKGDQDAGYNSLVTQSGYGTNMGNLGTTEGNIVTGNQPQMVTDANNEADYWDQLAKKGLSQGQQDTLLAGYGGDPANDAARATSAMETSEAARGIAPGSSSDVGETGAINMNFIQAYNAAKAQLGRTKMDLVPTALANAVQSRAQIVNPAISAAMSGWNGAANIAGQQANDYFTQANEKNEAQAQSEDALLGAVGGVAGAAVGKGWNPFKGL